MKLVKIFGIVMAFHAAAFMFIFAIPGCRSTTKKPAAPAPVASSEASPLTAAPESSAPAASPEVAVRFSPTRPGTPAAEAVVTPTHSEPSTYIVAKGDNLWSIAKKQGVTVKQLAAANKLSSDTPLKLGQKLTIPGKTPAPVAATASAPAPTVAPAAATTTKTQATTHVVKAGETLGTIAKKYQVKAGDIATANNIADPTKIRVGQTLKIPGGHAVAAKPAAPHPSVVAPAPAPTPTPAAPAAPLSPVFSSPIESAPAPSGSPFVTPSTETKDAPVIRVEEAGAPRIE